MHPLITRDHVQILVQGYLVMICSMPSANLGRRSVTPVTREHDTQNISYNSRYVGLRAGLWNRSWLVYKPCSG